MSEQLKNRLTIIAIVVVIVVAGRYALRPGGGMNDSGEANAKIWFYDQKGKRLYPVPADTLPPDDAVGGEFGDGVRAVVITFKKGESDQHKLKIAYLETYTPDLKATLNKIFAAHAAHKQYEGVVPSRNSLYFQTNDLVKRTDETTWYASNSSEGRKIMSEWRLWRGPQGERPLVAMP